MAFKVKEIRKIEEPFFLKDAFVEKYAPRVIGAGVGAIVGILASPSFDEFLFPNNIVFETGAVVGGTIGYLLAKRISESGKTIYVIEGRKIIADNKKDAIKTYEQYLEHKKNPHKFHIFHFKNNNKVVLKK